MIQVPIIIKVLPTYLNFQITMNFPVSYLTLLNEGFADVDIIYV